MTTHNEKLSELRRRRAQLVAKMRELVEKEDSSDDAPADGGDSNAQHVDVSAEFASVKADIQALDGRIERLETALREDASSASDDTSDGDKSMTPRPNKGGFRGAPASAAPDKPDVGLRVARFLIGVRHAGWNGQNYAKAAEFIQNRFNDSTVAKALNTLVVGEGGALIPQDFLADLIELLRANTVFRAAGPTTLSMPMGNLTIPRLAGGATAAYQGELDDIALTEEVFDDVNLVAKKLTAMVPVSNDLLRRAPIGVDGIVRDDLVQTIAHREDLAFLRGDGTGKSPVGLKSLCLPANKIALPAIAAGAPLDSIVAAISTAILTLQQGMSRMIKPVWIMAPSIARFIAAGRDSVGGFYYKDEIAKGTLEGYPVYISQQIPTNLGAGTGSEIYFVDMADVILADTLNVAVDASDVAAYYGTDGKVVSTFQRDQTLFRVISEHDINMRHLQSLVILTTVDWKFVGLPATPGGPWTTQPLNKTWAQAPAAWPADAVTPNPPPTLYVPGVVPTEHGENSTSAFNSPLTDYPGGLPPVSERPIEGGEPLLDQAFVQRPSADADGVQIGPKRETLRGPDTRPHEQRERDSKPNAPTPPAPKPPEPKR